MSRDPSPGPAAARLLGLAGAPATVAGVAGPLLLVAGAVAAGALPPERAMGAWSVRIWAVALCACTAAGLVAAVRERRRARGVALLAVAVATVQLLAGWALRFDGTLSAGIGEPHAPWERRDAGPLARAPAVELLELPVTNAPARLRFDGREVSLPPGRPTPVRGGTTLTVRGPYPAPSFEVTGADGARVEAGLVKIDPGKRDWFMVGFLPHRLYLSVPEGGIGPDPRAPQRLELRVQRGKLRVLDRELQPGERVSFERISFAFGAGEAWARVDVRRRAPLWPGLVLAAALGAGALALRAAGRRAR